MTQGFLVNQANHAIEAVMRETRIRARLLTFWKIVLASLVGSLLLTPVSSAQVAETLSNQSDPNQDLAGKKAQTISELEALSKDLSVSKDKAHDLEVSIKTLEKSTEAMRAALLDSASKRRGIEQRILASEKQLGIFKAKETKVRLSLRARRGLLAEVLAALQRMGANPPPALLVEPEDALASVRSAILLGAVVPSVRHEAEKLVSDLSDLTITQKSIVDERASLTALLQANLDEVQRTNLLIEENQKRNSENAAALEAEKQRAKELANQSTSLQGLITSLEDQIETVRKASLQAQEEENKRLGMTNTEREKALSDAQTGMPDKNRIAPAYAFSDLKARLNFPVAGQLVRNFGDPDGTGHEAQGIVIATNPGNLVTAPADGWIVYAGEFRSYGPMIILNTGEGYHLVVAGMETINVIQGQFVVAGEPLAVMGTKRVASTTAFALETDRPTLYIEFRKDGKPVDSRPWWSAADVGKARNDT